MKRFALPVAILLLVACNEPTRPAAPADRPAFRPIASSTQLGSGRAPSFYVTSLDLPGTAGAAAVNERGQVAATVVGSGLMPHDILWDRGAWVYLTDAPVGGSVGINNRGQVVGEVEHLEDATFHAFIWDNGVFTELDATPSDALGINDRGQIVGETQVFGPLDHAVEWLRGTAVDLGTGTGDFAFASSINERGEIAGIFRDAVEGNSHARIWEPDGSIVELPRPADRTYGNTIARAINELGNVVGEYEDGRGEERALMWSEGQVLNLGQARSNDIVSLAFGINDRNQIVGQSSRPVSDNAGWLRSNDSTYDLNDLIDPDDSLKPFLHITSAVSINNGGQIAVFAHDSRIGPCVKRNCPVSVYLLTPR